MLDKLIDNSKSIYDVFSKHPWFEAMLKTSIMMDMLTNDDSSFDNIRVSTMELYEELHGDLDKSIMDSDEQLFKELLKYDNEIRAILARIFDAT